MAWAFTTLPIHGVDETCDKGRVAGCLFSALMTPHSTCIHFMVGCARVNSQMKMTFRVQKAYSAATMLTLPILPDSHFANSPFLT